MNPGGVTRRKEASQSEASFFYAKRRRVRLAADSGGFPTKRDGVRQLAEENPLGVILQPKRRRVRLAADSGGFPTKRDGVRQLAEENPLEFILQPKQSNFLFSLNIAPNRLFYVRKPQEFVFDEKKGNYF